MRAEMIFPSDVLFYFVSFRILRPNELLIFSISEQLNPIFIVYQHTVSAC